MSKQDIEKRLGFAAQGVKETTRTSVKAKMAAIDAGMMDGSGNEVVIRMADGSRATAKYNRGTGKWSLEGHADIPTFANVRDLVAHLNKQGMSRPGVKTSFSNGATTNAFLSKIDAATRNKILTSIAKHYGISASQAMAEVTDADAESLLDYMTEPERSATSVLLKRHGFSRAGAKVTNDASSELARSIQVFRNEVDGMDNAYKAYLKKSNQFHKGHVVDSATYLRKYADRLVERANALEATKYSRPGAKAKFGIWGDAPDKYRAAIDFIQNQRTPSSAAINDLKKAIKNRQSEAVKTRDPKTKRMYEDDAGSLQNVLEHAQRGDHSTLLRSAYNLDTAVRDDIPIEMFIWAGADVNWSHRNAKSLLDTVSALVNRTKHGKSVGIKSSRTGVKASTDFDLAEACREGYEAVGTKKKDGKTVPNCVPKKKAARPGVKAKFASTAESVGKEAAVADKALGLLYDRLGMLFIKLDIVAKEVNKKPTDPAVIAIIQHELALIKAQAKAAMSAVQFARPAAKAKA